MVGIAISGVGGRMGANIVASVKENPLTELAGALEAKGHALVGKDAGNILGNKKTGIKITDNPLRAFKKADVIVDFSTPDATMRNLEAAVSLKKPIVIGTTGFSPHQREKVAELSRETPVLLAPNMSVGVNLLFKLVESCAKVLGGDYDIEIVESHHRHKADAPSGTALRIAEVAAHALKRDLAKVGVYGRKGIVGERKPDEIGILSVRAGDIVGDHTVFFCGNGERIELTHRAHSRATFAGGAVRAALWLKGKKAGLYDMQDALGLNKG